MFILLVISLVLLVNVSEKIELVVFSGIIVSLAILFLFLRPLQSFAVLVIQMLGAGFWLAIQGYINQWGSLLQLEAILKNLTFMSSVICLWMTVAQLIKYGQEYTKMREELHLLQKFEDGVAILTMNEFMYRMETIFIAMRRRTEKGYLLKIKINTFNKEFAIKSLYDSFVNASLKSVRDKYDLVGKMSNSEIVIMLQNTNVEGALVVENRFRNFLQDELTIDSDLFSSELIELPDEWSSTQSIVLKAAIA